MYYKDAARAMIQLGEAPVEESRRSTTSSMASNPRRPRQLAEIVRSRIPEARISFEPNAILQPAIDQVIRPLDDRRARAEWGWEPAYDQKAIVDDFLAEWRGHPERYR